MELVGRMMDGTISYEDRPALEPVPSAAGINQDEKMERLEAVPLFEACTQRQLRAVARIAEIFDAPAGTILIRAGDPGEEFFLIVEGTARVHVSARKRLRLRPGDFFGEMSLLDGEPRSATVVADSGAAASHHPPPRLRRDLRQGAGHGAHAHGHPLAAGPPGGAGTGHVAARAVTPGRTPAG